MSSLRLQSDVIGMHMREPLRSSIKSVLSWGGGTPTLAKRTH